MGFIARHFIVLNAVVVTLLVMSFLRMRRSNKRGPMRIADPRQKSQEVSQKLVIKKIIIEDENDPRYIAQEKSLNVMFNYNGHSWDAYEILGIPAGSGFEKSFQAYEKMSANVDKESREFLLAALEAIRMHHH